MNFIETENLHLRVPSKENLDKWTEWINSPKLRKTVSSTLIPSTSDMQWNWIQTELSSKTRLLLEFLDKSDNKFLGVVSLSTIDYVTRTAQISTISPDKKNKKNKYCVYEARRAILKYAFNELSINKVYAGTLFPDNKSYMIKNMCLGFEIEGIIHDSQWHNSKPKMTLSYFMTRSIFEKKKINDAKFEILFSEKNKKNNEKKLKKIISFLQVK